MLGSVSLDYVNKRQYTRPSAAKFVFVDMSTVHIELDTGIPSILLQKPRDWLICWFVTKKLGVSCVPGSGK